MEYRARYLIIFISAQIHSTFSRCVAARRGGNFVQKRCGLTFPSGNGHGSHAVSKNVDGRPAHVHELVDADTGSERMGLDEVARVVYFRPDTLPPGFQAEFLVTRHYVPRAWPFAFTNGVQASYLEVDIRTGEVKLLRHWCVEDCGTVINPQLVDEQIRGGIVQGIGAVLFEHCRYDDAGQFLNATMMDYLVPMAGEMPDMEIGHVVTPTSDSELGAKGAGEAGTAGAPACIMNAVNDALRPLGAAAITQMPITPELVLRALRG